MDSTQFAPEPSMSRHGKQQVNKSIACAFVKETHYVSSNTAINLLSFCMGKENNKSAPKKHLNTLENVCLKGNIYSLKY